MADPLAVGTQRTVAASRRHDLRAVRVVWFRELLRFSRDRLRILTSLVQPGLFLFVLGSGLSPLTAKAVPGTSFRTFVFPGAIGMAVMFTALFSAGSIVWDREFGFLREMLVAPVSRWALVVGKVLGGATVASAQGMVLLAFSGAVGVPYSPGLWVVLIPELVVLATAVTAFGVMVAARIKQFQSFMAVAQLFLMPLFFLSGALFPLSGLPTWLGAITLINPLTYGIDPIRRAVFSHVHLSSKASALLDPGVFWGGWRVPTGVELVVVAAMGATMVAIAIAQFRTPE